jgi:hypothetical protein
MLDIAAAGDGLRRRATVEPTVQVPSPMSAQRAGDIAYAGQPVGPDQFPCSRSHVDD